MAESLECLAAVDAAEGEDWARAARLHGAAAAIRRSLDAPLQRAARCRSRDREIAAARAALGEAAFCAAWAEGEAADWREAAAEALGPAHPAR